MKGLAFKKPQLTKRQRKSLRGINEVMRNSAAKGQKIIVAGTTYIGANPVFMDRNANNPTLTADFVKVRSGIPFVRVSA